MKLSTRLTVAMVGLVALTAAGVGLLTHYSIEAVLLPDELAHLQSHAGQLAAEFAAGVRGGRGDVLAARRSAALVGLLRAHVAGGSDPVDGSSEASWRERLATDFRAELAANPAYLQFRLIGVADGGREIVRVDRSRAGEAIRTVPEDELQRKGNRDYFIAAIGLAEGEVHVSSIELNREHGVLETPHTPVLRAATPVHAADGSPFGAVVVNIDLRPAFARLRASAWPGGQLYLVGSRGDYLVHPDPEREFAFDLGRRASFERDFPDLATALTAEASSARMFDDDAGLRHGCAAAPVQPEGGPPVAVIETVPGAALLAPTAQVRRASLFGGLAAAAVAVLVAVPLARSLTRPLEQITKAADALARGEPAAVPAGARGEIGVLARAFERMRAEVQEKTGDLEREVEVRRRAEREAELQAVSARSLSAVVESSYDAIVTMDLDGTITGWNPAAERLYGYSTDEAIGRNIEIIVPEERRDEVEALLDQVAHGERVEHFETVRLSKSGRRIEVSLTVSPVKSSSGAVVGASKIARDVTDRKLAEAALAARTRELERSNAELEHFAYVASHDLQEPLRMVASYTELLADRYRGRLDEQADKYIHYAVDGAQRMRRLVNDLLAYSRIGTQGKPLAATDSAEVVRRVLDDMEAAIAESGAEVTVGELPTVEADQTQLAQAFQNLIGNAIKFRSDEPPRIRVEAEPDDGDWRFSVADNGIGIDPAHAGTIFEMFKRLHERDRYEGSGIGLALVKKIVERHGGRVWVDSEAGHGAAFHFTLPPMRGDPR